jgi:hypothetical protein
VIEVADADTEKSAAGLTVNLKVVIVGTVSPRGVPVTVITTLLPIAAVAVVLMVSVVVKEGVAVHVSVPVQPPVNEAVAPAGRPVTARVTGWARPETNVAAIVVVPD